jgi:hypothetical protein
MTSTSFTAGESGDSPSTPVSRRSALDRLWQRDLDAYPGSGRRYGYLAIVVLTTIVLYYSLYIQYAVAEVPQISRTGGPIGFSPERNGIKCRENQNITLRSSRTRPSRKWSTPRHRGR